MANLLNIILRISGQNLAGGAITSANQGLELLEKAVESLNQSVGAFVRTGFEMNASLETTTLQFETLMGSAAEAEAHVKDLFALGAETPFETGPIIEASRNLEVFGGAALDTRENLVLLGDAAAATNARIEEVAFWTGRAYSAMQAGRPYGEASQRLQELGILSATARNELEGLQESGASASEQWQRLTADFERFDGAMAKQATTFSGLVSTMNDSLDLLAAHLTRPAFDEAKGGLVALNATLRDPAATRGMDAIGQGLVDLAGWTVAANVPLQAFIHTLDAAAAAEARVASASEDMTSAGIRLAAVMEAQTAAVMRQIPVADQARDSWAQLAHAEKEASDAALIAQGQALAHAGDINQIVAQEQVAAQQFAQQQAEQAAKEQQRAQESAAREAERIAREHWDRLNALEDRAVDDRRRLEDRAFDEDERRWADHLQAQAQADEDYLAGRIARIEAERDAQLDAIEAQLAALDAEAEARHRRSEDIRDQATLQQAQQALADALRTGHGVGAARERLAEAERKRADELADRAAADAKAALEGQRDAVKDAAQAAIDGVKAQQRAVEDAYGAADRASRDYWQHEEERIADWRRAYDAAVADIRYGQAQGGVAGAAGGGVAAPAGAGGAAGAAVAAAGGGGIGSLTVNVTVAGGDGDAIARAVVGAIRTQLAAVGV